MNAHLFHSPRPGSVADDTDGHVTSPQKIRHLEAVIKLCDGLTTP